MYQKISDQVMTLEERRNKELREEAEKKSTEGFPMSYILCPKCDSEEIEKCSCEGGYNNYYCKFCGFKNIIHQHTSFDKEGTSKFIKKMDSSLLAKTVRK